MRTYHAPSYSAFCEPTAGDTVWPIDWEDGFIDKAYIKASAQDFDGTWYDVALDTRRITTTTVPLFRPLRPCKTLLIYRDTPKDTALTVYGHGGTVLADEGREVAIRQAMHVLVELVDLGRRQHDGCLCGCTE